MGRGDKRSAKGKRFKGSFGNTRPQRVKKTSVSAKAKAGAKKEKAPKTEKVEKVEKPVVKKAPAKKLLRKKAEE